MVVGLMVTFVVCRKWTVGKSQTLKDLLDDEKEPCDVSVWPSNHNWGLDEVNSIWWSESARKKMELEKGRRLSFLALSRSHCSLLFLGIEWTGKGRERLGSPSFCYPLSFFHSTLALFLCREHVETNNKRSAPLCQGLLYVEKRLYVKYVHNYWGQVNFQILGKSWK